MGGLYGAGWQNIVAATGAEQVLVDNGGSQKVYLTTAQIAALAADAAGQIINTAITTVGNGTLTAAGLVGGLITRTGPVAAYSDATDSAADIVAAMPGFAVGAQFSVTVKNATAYLQTIIAGAGVTLPLTVIVGPFQEATYYGTVGGTVAAPTVVLGHINTVPIAEAQNIGSPQIIAIATVGAGSITAAAIAGGLIARGGTQVGAFTDTTDTGPNIIAASVGLIGKIGSTILFKMQNNTGYVQTLLANATGVTLAGVTTIPPNTIGQFQVSYTGAGAVTVTGLGVTQAVSTALTIGGATSGFAAIQTPATAGAVTLTTPPVASAGTLASTSGANLAIIDVYRCTSAQTANANVVPANITGLSGAVAVGTYEFEAALYCTIASGTGGVAINQLLTTAVLGACNFEAVGFLAAGVATQATTTATSGTVLYTAANQPLLVLIKGTFTVTTAGTFGLQMCQSASNASNSVVNIGSTMKLTRIA